MALADFQEAHHAFRMKNFQEARLALNVAALGGEIFQTGVKQGFVSGQQGVRGGIDSGEESGDVAGEVCIFHCL